MTAPVSAARLTIHDQLLINLCGWLALRVFENPNEALMLAQLRRVLPNASPDHPFIGPLVDVAATFLDRSGMPYSLDYAHARLQLGHACLQVFMARATTCAAQVWPDENTQANPETPTASEPAHAAQD